jgi:hypothetical protein
VTVFLISLLVVMAVLFALLVQHYRAKLHKLDVRARKAENLAADRAAEITRLNAKVLDQDIMIAGLKSAAKKLAAALPMKGKRA